MKTASNLAAVLAASGLVTFAFTATAATITNLDDKPYALVVFEGEKEKHITVEPQQELSSVCGSDCTIEFGDDKEQFDVAAGDRLFIEQGEVFFEESTMDAPAVESEGQSR